MNDNNNNAKSIYDLFMHHAGIESIQPTQHTDTKGRWLIITYKSLYDETKNHLLKMFNDIIPKLPAETLDKYKKQMGSSPKIYTPSPFGCDIHEQAETLARCLARLHAIDQPNRTEPKNTTQKFTTVLFDDLDAFPPLPTDKTTNTINSEIPPALSTNQTFVSNDIDTVVSELKSIVSQQMLQMQTIVDNHSKTIKEQNASMQAAMMEQNFTMKAMIDQ
jgi:hypothetical protein